MLNLWLLTGARDGGTHGSRPRGVAANSREMERNVLSAAGRNLRRGTKRFSLNNTWLLVRRW